MRYRELKSLRAGDCITAVKITYASCVGANWCAGCIEIEAGDHLIVYKIPVANQITMINMRGEKARMSCNELLDSFELMP
jgi:hypothetical protein